MTVSTLDANIALIIIDLQKGIVSLPIAHPISDVLANAAALAEAFRQHSLPVVLVNVAGRAPGRTEAPPRIGEMPADWAELVPELNQQAEDHTVTKRTWGAFIGTGLDDYLKTHGVTQVVVAGVATSAGVESTARQAFELGFNVTLAVDAMSDMQAAAHENSLKYIFPRIGETGTSQEIIDLLAQTR